MSDPLVKEKNPAVPCTHPQILLKVLTEEFLISLTTNVFWFQIRCIYRCWSVSTVNNRKIQFSPKANTTFLFFLLFLTVTGHFGQICFYRFVHGSSAQPSASFGSYMIHCTPVITSHFRLSPPSTCCLDGSQSLKVSNSLRFTSVHGLCRL